MTKIAILQSNCIPWMGYFDLIAAVDEFTLYDDMQYSRRDWKSRNQFKTSQGVFWLTVPAKVKGWGRQTIGETEIEGAQWARGHWKSLLRNYRRAPSFSRIAIWLEPLYMAEPPTRLSKLEHCFIKAICTYLGIKTTISNSWDHRLSEGKSERLADLCVSAEGARIPFRPCNPGAILKRLFPPSAGHQADPVRLHRLCVGWPNPGACGA